VSNSIIVAEKKGDNRLRWTVTLRGLVVKLVVEGELATPKPNTHKPYRPAGWLR